MDDASPLRALTPAVEMAARGPIRIPGESDAYRAARTALLAEEIELRRHLARVAEQRRALPAGAEVTREYRFVGPEGEVTLTDLFGDKDTLVAYTYMFGPKRAAPCPMCTNLLGGWEGNARDADQKISLVVIAGSPIERLLQWKIDRGWKHLRLYSNPAQDYLRDWFGFLPDGSETAAVNVFTRRDGRTRHFWTGEMTEGDPGQDARGAPDMAPLWNILDLTPEGRATDWYPKLDY